MVKHIEFRTALVNTELGEAYTWIELRNHVEQNLTTKRLFDDWDKDAVLRLISPYLNGTRKHEACSFLEALEVVFEEVRDNDTVIDHHGVVDAGAKTLAGGCPGGVDAVNQPYCNLGTGRDHQPRSRSRNGRLWRGRRRRRRRRLKFDPSDAGNPEAPGSTALGHELDFARRGAQEGALQLTAVTQAQYIRGKRKAGSQKNNQR